MNASAGISSCEQMMDDSISMSQSMTSDVMIDATSKMSAMDDCCEIIQVVCDHSNACDCDNSQVSYSAVPSLQIVNSQYLGHFKPRYNSPPFHSKSSDSLYRPPISIL